MPEKKSSPRRAILSEPSSHAKNNKIINDRAEKAKPPNSQQKMAYRLVTTKKLIQKLSLGEINNFELMDYMLSFILPAEEIERASNLLAIKFGTLAQIIDTPHNIIKEVMADYPRLCDFLCLIQFLILNKETSKLHDVPIFSDKNDLENYLRSGKLRSRYEHLRILLVDSLGCLLADEELDEPTPELVTIPFKKIIRRVFMHESIGFVLVRYTPLPTVVLNEKELNSIQQLHDLCRMLSLEMLDFIIVSGEEITSLFASGTLRG